MGVTIPKVVHRIWFGPHEMRPELVEFGRSWERHGYQVKLWTERNLPPLRNQRIYDRIGKTRVHVGGGVPELGVWVQRADVVAYELVWRFGGIVANTDVECLRPLDPILDGVEAFAAWEEQDVWVCNALMGATPHHPFFARVLEELPLRYDSMPNEPMNATTGPGLITEVYKRKPGKLTVLDENLIYPYRWAPHDMPREWDDHPDAYTSHHWGHTRGRWSKPRHPDAA